MGHHHKNRAAKKLRNEHARIEKLRKVGAEAAHAALTGERHRETLMRVIAALTARIVVLEQRDRPDLERVNGAVVVPFTVISAAPALTLRVVGEGDPNAAIVLQLAKMPVDTDPVAVIPSEDVPPADACSPG